MEITKFEKAITNATATLLLGLERAIGMGVVDEEVTPQMLIAAIRLKNEIADSLEDYAGSVLEQRGLKD